MFKNKTKVKKMMLYIICAIILFIIIYVNILCAIKASKNEQPDPLTHTDIIITPTREILEESSDDTYISNEEDNVTENETTDVLDKPEAEQVTYDIIGYTTASLNVRSEPNTDCDIYEVFPSFTQIQFAYIEDNPEWVTFQYGEVQAYLYKEYVAEGLPYEAKPAENDTRKSYMDWRKITRKTSKQYELQKDHGYTTSNGVRAANGRYCIALGSYYTQTIGQYVDVVLENGIVLPCILGDVKQDIHTTNNHSIGLDGGVVEFIVDTRKLPELARKMGDVSYISNEWKSNVVEVRVYYNNLFDQ